MNPQNTENFQLQGYVANFTLFQQLFVREEKKAQPPIPSKNMLNISTQKKFKKKGRPKTDKALLQKIRKDGNDDSGIDRQKGHWSNQENKKYHLFLEIHHMHFLQREMRRVDKIFKSMSSFLRTREAQQCRSHHQKMQKKYNNFGNILLYLRRSNYGTQEQDLVLNDLRMQTDEIPQLLSGEQLMNMAAQIKNEKQVKNKMLACVEGKEQNIDTNKNVSFENLLGDNYESQFGLNFFS